MKCISQWDEQPGFQAQSHTAALNQCCQFGGKTQHFSVLICHCGNPETDCGDRVNPPGRSPCQPRHHFIGNHSKSPLCGHKLDALRRLPAHPSLRPELRSPQLRSARSAGADAAPGAGNATADRSRLPAADTRLPTPVLALRPDGSSQSPLRCCRSPPPARCRPDPQPRRLGQSRGWGRAAPSPARPPRRQATGARGRGVTTPASQLPPLPLPAAAPDPSPAGDAPRSVLQAGTLHRPRPAAGARSLIHRSGTRQPLRTLTWHGSAGRRDATGAPRCSAPGPGPGPAVPEERPVPASPPRSFKVPPRSPAASFNPPFARLRSHPAPQAVCGGGGESGAEPGAHPRRCASGRGGCMEVGAWNVRGNRPK